METFHRWALFLCLLAAAFQAPAQNYQPEISMDLEAFQKQALGPKEDVWVVDFWATWCRPCIQAIPHMKQLHQKYQDRGVRFVSVSWDRNEAQWLSGLEHFKMPWQHLIVPKGQEAWLDEAFPHKGIPTAFVIDRDGRIKKVSDVYKLDKVIYKAL